MASIIITVIACIAAPIAVFVECQFNADQLSCDFDSPLENGGLCNYSPPDGTNASFWKITDGAPRHSNIIDGPLSGVGHSGNKATLLAPPVRLSGNYCLSLDYFLMSPRTSVYSKGCYLAIYGDNGGEWSHDSFGVFVRPAQRRGPSHLLFLRDESTSYIDQWQHFEETVIIPDNQYRIAIHAEADIPGTIALDNLKLVDGPCRHVESDEKFCEKNCDWLEVVDRPTNRNQRVPDTFITHSGGRGARSTTIKSRIFNPEEGTQCLSFQVALSGERDARPNLLVEKAVNSDVVNVLKEFNFKDLFRRSFYQEFVDIDPVVPITLELKLDSGDVDLRHIKLTKGKCPKGLNCKFVNDFCGWTPSDNYNHINWFIGKGRLEKPNPNYEANFERGLYLDLSRGIFMRQTDLLSPRVDAVGRFCFRLSYIKQYGTDLKIRVQDVDQVWSNLDVHFSDENEIGQAYANVLSKNPFRINLQISKSYVDGDNVTMFRLLKSSLKPGDCGVASVKRVFGDVNFHCHQTGHYIAQYRSCDGVIDCPMGEDEDEHCLGGHECSNGGIPCTRRGHKFCLNDASQFCDGTADCDDDIDEDPRMCNSESFCENYCLSDGECNSQAFRCDCKEDFVGKRCT